MCEEFMDIPRNKLDIISEYKSRICKLFGVEINVYNNEDDFANVEIKLGADCRKSQSSNNYICKKVQEYIRSVTGTGVDHCTCTERYNHKVYQLLQKNHDNIENESQAILNFIDDGTTVLISGQSFSVAIAKSLMERMRFSSSNSDVSRLMVNTATQDVVIGGKYSGNSTGPCEEENNKHTTLMHTLSPGGESSHDSCYDSDCSPSSSRRNSTQHLDADFHSDVSRTTSDTLAAELVEKEDLKRSASDQCRLVEGCKSLSRSVDNPSISDVPNNEYSIKVEFALKLGYTEEHIKSALVKLGTDVDENALLSELIKLGSQDPLSTGNKSSVNNSHKSNLSAEGSKSLTLSERKSLGDHDDRTNLRPIVIDGSNVAMSHGNKEIFSCLGIKLAVDFFRQHGHEEITVFVPQWRKEASRIDSPITDQEVLYDLEKDKLLVFTPARRVGGKRVVCYDDRYIIKLAAENGGVVVSNDNYRDLLGESPEFKQVIEERLLMYSFVNDRFMPPDDPLGRHGPTLEQFLRKDTITQDPLPPVCPYGKKCTYGNKCKYYHPERGSNPHKSVTDKLKEETTIRIKQAKEKGLLTPTNSIGDSQILSNQGKKPLTSTKSLTLGGSIQQPQKKTLARTKSLVPGPSNLFDSVPYGGHSLENLDLTRSGSPVFPATRPLSPNLTLTLAPTELESTLNARHDLQADIRHKKSPGNKRGSYSSSPRRSPSPREVSPRGSNQQSLGPSLTVPHSVGHWAVMHEALRPVHSDPTSSFGGRGGGHVHLVKKLSDVNMCMDDSVCFMMPPRVADSVIPHQAVAKSASIGDINQHHQLQQQQQQQQQQQGDPQTVHKKLQRQLSLKGAEDPRISNRGKPQQQGKSNVPIVKFHGTTIPTGRPVLQQHHHHHQIWHQHPSAMQHMFATSNPVPVYQNVQVQMEPDIRGHSVYGRRTPTAAEFHSENTVQKMAPQHQNLKPPETVKGHTPLGRMSSAPERFGSSLKAETTPNVLAPAMNRQNSTSDSRLNIPKEELSDTDKETLAGVYGDPRWAFEGSISGQIQEEVKRSHQEKWLRMNDNSNSQSVGSKDTDVFYLMPDGSHQRKPNMLNQQTGGIKVAFGTAASNVPLHRPIGYPTQGRATPGAPVSRQKTAPAQLSTVHPQSQMHLSASTGNINTLPDDKLNENQGGENQQLNIDSSNSSEGFSENDPRAQIFYHLRFLFNEDKVRQVMSEHPEETNPQVLCAYLLAR